jgi:hypothetical protein
MSLLRISHRGNTEGKEPERENTPEYILEAAERGFDVEIDVWLVSDKLFLGHDGPQYETTLDFLRDSRFWRHAKNGEALALMLGEKLHCFWHQEDEFTLTSHGIIWTFPKKKLFPGSICVMPELGYLGNLQQCKGVCSDLAANY